MRLGKSFYLLSTIVALVLSVSSCGNNAEDGDATKPVLNNPNQAKKTPSGIISTRQYDMDSTEPFRLPEDGGLPTQAQLNQGRESDVSNQNNTDPTQPSTVIRPTPPNNDSPPKPDEDQLDSD